MGAINQATNSNNNNNNTMLDSYRVGNAGAVKRIGTPHEHDILCGRGGAINSHIGNQRFREWVRERKDRYNLARTKAEKAHVANEVMDLVKHQNPPGRFLQRDQSSVMGGTTWWVECDEVKALAKTSQALREGAPSIRAAHKDELQEAKKRTRKSKKNSTATSSRATTMTGKRSHQTMQQPNTAMRPMPPIASSMAVPMTNQPVTPTPVALTVSRSQAIEQLKANVEAAKQTDNSNKRAASANVPYSPVLASPPALPLPGTMTSGLGNFSSSYTPPMKRSRLSENLYLPPADLQPQPHIVKPDEETPPLAPLPSPVPLNAIPDFETAVFPMPAIPKRESSIRRSNSLALSDIGSGSDGWGDIEFVNPFEGDDIVSLPPFSPCPEPRNGNGPRSSRNSLADKSVTSELSDLYDGNAHVPTRTIADSEFGEAMKDIYDAVHPGLATPRSDEPIPTHLYPYTPGGMSGRGSGSMSSPQLIC